MKGIFKKRKLINPFLIFILPAGSFASYLFIVLAINAIRNNSIASALFSVFLGLFMLSITLVFAASLLYNKDAFLLIENDTITAKYGINQKYTAKINDLTDIEVIGDNVRLHTENNFVQIGGLTNAKEIYTYIKELLSNKDRKIDMEHEEKVLQAKRNKFIKNLIGVIVTSSLMFINILWCSILTKGKDLNEFSEKEEIIFACFVIVEMLTIITAFFFASKCGKANSKYKLSKQRITKALAYEHRRDGLEIYPSVISIKYFDDYLYRIIIFAPEMDIFAYILEMYDKKTSKWVSNYPSAIEFGNLSDLYETLETEFPYVDFDE